MSQQHLDRLPALDASFLHQEGPSSHMHVGALCRFEGPPPPFDELLDTLRMRLHLVPRYRQRLQLPPAGTGRPLWVDDSTFDLEYHVRHTALPRPGSEDQLLLLAGRVFSQQLDRDRPLWEMWMVEGLADGGFALLSKTHHAMIDGIAGVDIAQVMFDLSPVPAETEHPDAAWQPARPPSPAEVRAAGGLGMLRTGVRGATLAAGVLREPRSALLAARDAAEGLGEIVWAGLNPGPAPRAAAGVPGEPRSALLAARDAAEGLGEIVWAGLNPAPETPLNVDIGPHRRYAIVRTRLDDFKLVKNTFGGTINDVVLAVVSGALRDWLRSRGVRTE